jgi:hypothetical protein
LETDRIVREFIARTLPKSEWTHHAHLRVGLWHALQYPDAAALELLRGRISAYNGATGVANTAQSGYHETITRFYVHVIRVFVRSVNPDSPIDELAHALIGQWGDKHLPLRHYSPHRLFSADARRAWIEPDLAPLPK